MRRDAKGCEGRWAFWMERNAEVAEVAERRARSYWFVASAFYGGCRMAVGAGLFFSKIGGVTEFLVERNGGFDETPDRRG